MSQKPDITTFDIRKLSLFKIDHQKENKNTALAANEWFHFPQRSDITINFFKYLTDKSSFHISIIWKGNVLDQTYWHQGTNNFITSIGKYPSLGFKIISPKGELIKRFQISFNTKDVYDRCCKCVEGKLKLTLNRMDAMAPGDNSQIVDYPSQNNVATPEGQTLISRFWENASNIQSYHQSSQALCRPQYIPTLKQPTSFSQLENSTSDILPEHRKQNQVNTSKKVLGISQLYNNTLLPQYQYPQGYYTQYQPYLYLQTTPQQRTFNNDVIVENRSMPLEPWNIDYSQEVIPHHNPKALLVDQPLSNRLLINLHESQNHTTNELLDCNRYDTNKMIKERRVLHNKKNSTDKDENKKTNPTIKEEKIQPTEIEKKNILVNSSSIQKSLSKQKSKPKCDIFNMKDGELKRLIVQKLKDKKFVNFVEKLDKIVSQP